MTEERTPIDLRPGWKLWDPEKNIYRWWTGRQWADTYQRIENKSDD